MSLYFALLTVENNKNKKSVEFQGDMLNFCDFIQVYVFTTNHHLKTRNHRLPIETGIWTGIPVKERLCNLCKIDIGDEYHYIMICDYFKDLRKKLIRQYYIKHPNTIKFFELMNNRKKKTIVNLCAFIKVIVKTTPAFHDQF